MLDSEIYQIISSYGIVSCHFTDKCTSLCTHLFFMSDISPELSALGFYYLYNNNLYVRLFSLYTGINISYLLCDSTSATYIEDTPMENLLNYPCVDKISFYPLPQIKKAVLSRKSQNFLCHISTNCNTYSPHNYSLYILQHHLIPSVSPISLINTVVSEYLDVSYNFLSSEMLHSNPVHIACKFTLPVSDNLQQKITQLSTQLTSLFLYMYINNDIQYPDPLENLGDYIKALIQKLSEDNIPTIDIGELITIYNMTASNHISTSDDNITRNDVIVKIPQPKEFYGIYEKSKYRHTILTQANIMKLSTSELHDALFYLESIRMKEKNGKIADLQNLIISELSKR